MSSFHQPCPRCGAKLEMPVEARGRSAICPGCGHQFVAEAAPPESQVSTAPKRQAPVWPQETIKSVSIEDIVNDARDVFGSRKRPLLVPFLLPSILVLLGIVFPLAVLSDRASTNMWQALLWTVGLFPLFIVVLGYTVWFAMNLAVDVCDAGEPDDPDNPPPIRSWWIPDARVFWAVLTLVGITLMGALLTIALAVSLIQVGQSLPAMELRLIPWTLAVVGGAGFALAVVVRCWPLLPFAMDGRMAWDSMRNAMEMTRANMMTSFVLVTIATVALGVGFSFFGLGLPFAIPIACLLCAVAARRIRGRRIPAIDEPPMPPVSEKA